MSFPEWEELISGSRRLEILILFRSFMIHYECHWFILYFFLLCDKVSCPMCKICLHLVVRLCVAITEYFFECAEKWQELNKMDFFSMSEWTSISTLKKWFLNTLTFKTTMMEGREIPTRGGGEIPAAKITQRITTITNISNVQGCEAEKDHKCTTVTPVKASWLKWTIQRLIRCKQAILHLMNANTEDSLCACSSLIHLLWRIIMSNTRGVWTWDQTVPQTQKEKRKTSNL